MKKSIFTFAALLLNLVIFSSGCSFIPFQASPERQSRKAEESCPPCDNAIPQTNAEIRAWYNKQVVIIPALTEQLSQEGASAEERAKLAYDIRHRARMYARLLMPDKDEVELLRQRDMKKYGNPDGPTFAYLVEKNQEKGLEGDAIYEAIIESSSRTSAEYNARFGIKQESKQ
ncbi:MAG: hypothetical protein SD837_13665 [Candidatus Electrothrix scaldis]|nr:MAG: hypothetical protein SD837_13665 [Candidatus Electrothrix sp. GW3-3]